MSAAPKVISDRLFNELQRLVNTNIHELVFAAQHLEDNNIEEALDAFHQVRMNLDTIYDKVIRARNRYNSALRTPKSALP